MIARRWPWAEDSVLQLVIGNTQQLQLPVHSSEPRVVVGPGRKSPLGSSHELSSRGPGRVIQLNAVGRSGKFEIPPKTGFGCVKGVTNAR